MGNGGGWELHTPDESKLLFTHTRERERERERKGQQREHGTTKFSAYPSFPLFRSLAGREEKFLLPKSCHDEGMKYKKSYCRKRSRGASSTSRGERRKRKKEEKCRTRQLFFCLFFSFPGYLLFLLPFRIGDAARQLIEKTLSLNG